MFRDATVAVVAFFMLVCPFHRAFSQEPSLSSIYPDVKNEASSSIHDGESDESPFVFSFPSHRWNLLVDSQSQSMKEHALTGWQSVQAFSMADSFSNFYFYGQTPSKEITNHDGSASTNYEEILVAPDGSRKYYFRDFKGESGEVFESLSSHSVKSGNSVDTRVMVSSERGGNSDFFIADISSPSRTTEVGISANVGRIRVWGEFQMNDWNGLGGTSRVSGSSSSESSVPDVSVAAVSSRDSSALSSMGANSVSGDTGLVSGRTAFEVGAAFPASRMSGAVRYRRSYDDVDTSGGLSREHFGFEGEVRIEDDVYLKAGYEMVNSVSPVDEQKESSLWTGIEINF